MGTIRTHFNIYLARSIFSIEIVPAPDDTYDTLEQCLHASNERVAGKSISYESSF